MSDTVSLNHGSGGRLSHELIDNLFVKYFSNSVLNAQTDSAIVGLDSGHVAFTTDSYVVDPVFFPGGNIGKLSVCGTINDLSVSGAVPAYLSAGFIIEEGFSIHKLEQIVCSMAEEAEKAGVKIVTGDTKVVNKGKADKIYINTAGIGTIDAARKEISFGTQIRLGDKIIVNGDLGRHEIAIMTAREKLGIETSIESDCASLNSLTESVLSAHGGIHFMRDLTRGGLAGVLNEVVAIGEFGITLNEEMIPANDKIRSICELLGLDALFMANEGRIMFITDSEEADKIMKTMKNHPLGKNCAVIGEITDLHEGTVLMETEIGGRRIIDMPAGQQLPRIC
ncbi:MAG: hydrogenase expression/formation protein HypE [Bacteroidales bacterium]